MTENEEKVQPVSAEEKKEAVDETIKELAKEKEARLAERKNRGVVKFFRTVGRPFRAFFKLIQQGIRKMRLPLTVKMLLIFSFVFSIMLIGYAFFIIKSVEVNLSQGTADEAYITGLVITSAITISLAVIVFTALTGVISSLLLNPIRKITKGIDEITAEDLSMRLDAVDTQDELMELTNRINGMLDNIEETFKRQENFVADASHELKTPIAVITGYANLLNRWGAKDENILKEGIDAIVRESDNMRRIVEQLLLLARLGKIHSNNSRFDADKEFREMVESYKMVHKARRFQYNGGEEIILETDKNLLVELVRVLVDNAVKYSPEDGKIEISTCLTEENAFKIAIKDNGIGISKEDLPLIYDRFFRCDKARGRESGGSGLGLTIAKSISDTLGGEIDVESELGKGTTFTFTLY